MAGTLTISTLSDGTNSTSSTNCIQGSAKAWVNFNASSGTAVINTSYNVSSITTVTTGSFTVNFTNALTDANYVVVGSSGTGASDYRQLVPNFNLAPTASACRVQTASVGTNTANNDLYNSVAFLR